MSARDRIPRMQPDNQPAAARPVRRRPPDEDPVPQPADVSRDLSVVPDTSDSASRLASLLAGSDNPDTQDKQAPGGRDALIDALTAPPPPVDPDLELVPIGVRIPQYVATALRTLSFLRHRRQQELVLEALRQYVPPELLEQCRRSATRTR